MKTIETKYHGATNTKGSKMSASDGDMRIYVSYEHAFNADQNHMAAAKQFMAKRGWVGKMQGGHTKTGMVFVFSDAEMVIEVAAPGHYVTK